ncbi:MAG: prepilin-type N-terminal cleavage/methylation domain-containing protein [Myxococcota bacterium]|nr:prepilin-type N-terminal cleavage/methylation domain-containing protein [Myxococcota bacterium]
MRRRTRAGFTLVELLVVIVVSTMGFLALFQLQISTLRGLSNSRRIIEASNLGENFIEQLRLEFMAWTDQPGEGLGDVTKFPHLAGLTPTGAGVGAQTPGGEVTDATGWVIGDEDGGQDRRVSRVGDPHPQGFNIGSRKAMITHGFEGDEQPYCLHYRLTWLIVDRAIRAEVEVSWPLLDADIETFRTCNRLASDRLNDVRSVTLTSTLAVNTFQR